MNGIEINVDEIPTNSDFRSPSRYIVTRQYSPMPTSTTRSFGKSLRKDGANRLPRLTCVPSFAAALNGQTRLKLNLQLFAGTEVFQCQLLKVHALPPFTPRPSLGPGR